MMCGKSRGGGERISVAGEVNRCCRNEFRAAPKLGTVVATCSSDWLPPTELKANMPRPRRAGFTLIELLIVVVIIGVLAAIAIPKYEYTKSKAYAATMKTDLRNLATAQEAYYYTNEIYTTDVTALAFTTSSGVTIAIPEATAQGWSALATHPLLLGISKCALFFGVATPVAPAVNEGQVVCN